MKRHLLLFALLLLISGAMFGQTYTITVSAGIGGSVYVGDTPGTTQLNYLEGDTCEITATQATGYTFVNWKEGTEVFSNEANYSFLVYDSHDLTANFAPNSHTLTVNYQYVDGTTAAPTHTESLNYGETYSVVSPNITGYTPNQATVSGAMPDYDVTVNVTYNINSHTLTIYYKFADGTTAAPTHTESLNYGETYSVVSPSITGYTPNQATVSGTMPDNDVTVNVTYNINSHTLTIYYKYTDGTTAAPTHTESLNYGETYSVVSPSITGYTPNQATVSGTMPDNDVTVNVTYNINSHTLTIYYKYADGTTASPTFSQSYNYNVLYSVDSPVIQGYTPSQSTVSGTMPDNDLTVNVTYTAIDYTIQVSANPQQGGTVSGGGTYIYNQYCTIEATPATGYNFVNWTKNGSPVSTSQSYTFQVTEAAEYVAHFTTQSYNITATADPEAGGTITGTGGYDYGQTCTLTATTNTGYTFVNWTKNGTQVSQNESYSFTVTETATYVAHFQINSYTITTGVTPNGAGTVTGGGTYPYGTTITLTANENYGYTFSQWQDGNTQISRNIMVTENATYTASYTTNQYTITTNVNPTGSGTVTGGGTYDYGTTVTLTATANYGYTFDHWNDGNTQNPHSITVTGNATYTAYFTPILYTITTEVTPEGSGTVTGGDTYPYGTTITLTATNSQGYSFDHWQDGNTQPQRTITIERDSTFTATFTPNLYTITTNVTPNNAGTVTGGGTHPYGTTITLTVNENYGYTFDHWNDGNTQNPRSIMVTGNATYTANFTYNQYTITTEVTPEGWGTVTGGGTYNYHSSILLTATANPGYSFGHWQDGNSQNPRQITVTENATYTATFTRNQYTIHTEVSPVGTGTVTGGGAFYYGDQTVLTATANSGYNFLSWNDGVTDNPRQIIVTGDATYTANFGQAGVTYYNVTAAVSPEGAGYVTGTGSFQPGSTTTLLAHANSGYTFDHWNDGNTQNPRTVTVNSNLAFIAYFTQLTYTITTDVNPAGSGTVTGGGSNFHYGDQATLTATANNGYYFERWNDDVTQNPRTITVYGNATYTAYFHEEAATEYTITTEVSPTGAGTVSGGGTYPEGTTVTLTATPNGSYLFDHWQDGITDNPRTITVNGNATYTAYFTMQQYTITTEVTPEGSGDVAGGGTYPEGATVTLTASPNTGYTFDHWQDGITDNPRTITVTENFTYTASFTAELYTITLLANPEDGGTVEGGGEYIYGETCTVIATANEGYSFINWTENDYQASNEEVYEFTVTDNRTLVANFAPEGSCIIYVDIDPGEEAGMTTGAGAYQPGDECTLKAFAKTGYTFVNWTLGTEVVSERPNYTFTVTETARYTAHFERQKYHITASTNPEEGGTASVSGNGYFYYGTNCTLTARANSGYTFSCWTDSDGVSVSEELVYTFRVTADASFTANFTQEQQYTITVTANPEEGGEVSGGGEFGYNVTCTITATANPGYTFTNWKLGNTVVSTESTYSFQVTNNATYVANFTPVQEYTISTDVTPENAGTVEGGGTYPYGTQVSLTAIANENYFFEKWDDGSTDNPRTITVTGNMQFVAIFKKITCIENLQEIVAKEHKVGSNTYTLVLIYPKVDDEGNNINDDYKYQWKYSQDGANYVDLKEGTYDKQYYYKGGRLKDGYYKVQITKGECSDETGPYLVSYSGHLRIYPNPARSIDNMMVVKDCEGPAQLAIYSVDGRLLHIQTVTSDQATIDINLAPGVYVAYLTDNEGYTNVGKLIIK